MLNHWKGSCKMEKIKILLIEKSPIVAKGLQSMLQECAHMEVVAVLTDLDRLQERLIAQNPDVIILNPSLIDFSKRQSFKSLIQEAANIPIVALVYAYFEKQWLNNFDAVIDISDDRSRIEKKINDVIHIENGHNESADVYELSDREREVLIELAKGLMNKEIATKLHISIHTVMTHRKNIIRKTGIKSTAGLAVYAMLNNLVEESELGLS